MMWFFNKNQLGQGKVFFKKRTQFIFIKMGRFGLKKDLT
jgi:hypothetical protein